MDGQKEHHDFSVCKEGGYEIAAEGIKEAVQRGSASPPTRRCLTDSIPQASATSSTK